MTGEVFLENRGRNVLKMSPTGFLLSEYKRTLADSCPTFILHSTHCTERKPSSFWHPEQFSAKTSASIVILFPVSLLRLRTRHYQLVSCMMSTGVLLCLLLWINGLVLGEISENFFKCLNFFYNDTPPTGIDQQGYKPICQRYKNKYHFASLYDCKRRIPLYSAYILSCADGPRPKVNWMYEPQV